MTATSKRGTTSDGAAPPVKAKRTCKREPDSGTESPATSAAKGQGSSSASTSGWTAEETLVLAREIARTALENIPRIASASGLEGKSGRGGAHVNVKMRTMLKHFEKAHGGDGEWVAKYRLSGAGIRRKETADEQ